ncbi:dynein light chain Tctex-type 5-like [Littorina saxatilis]|uniref:Dynein light chain n=1 Tax=Littorina saxatilis TaxID=31220 RepID=A0AAN9B8N6_9CAEN
MDKFPARRQGNQWGSRQGNNNNNVLKTSSFSTKTTMDSVALPDRAAVMGMGGGQSGRRTGIGLNRRSVKMAASEADKHFKVKLVEKSAEQVMSEKLKDVVYDSNACRDMSPEVASAIVERLREFCVQQYKLVCVLSLGSLKEKPGVQFGSRCLWNKDTDNFVSVRYSNGSVYAVALIFGLYFESTE